LSLVEVDLRRTGIVMVVAVDKPVVAGIEVETKKDSLMAVVAGTETEIEAR